MKSYWKFIIILLLVLPFTSPVHAQIPSSIDGIDISANSPTPGPGEQVTVSVESYSTDLNGASIVWLVNGKGAGQGTGLKSILVTSPTIGKTVTILAIIMTIEGREVRKTIIVKSGGVDLIWESAGFVPPFYKGKSLFAYENTIRVTALPHLAGSNGSEIDPRTLLYKWTENDKVIQNQSGYGKQTLTLQEEIPRPFEVLVEVSTRDGSQKGSSSVTLTPTTPSVSFYQEDPLYGVLYNNALSNKIRLNKQELTIRAVPYSFNQNQTNSPLSYIWSINNLEQSNLSKNQSIVLRTKGDTEGTSDISLEVRNALNILQGARNSLGIVFSKKTGGGTVPENPLTP